MSNSLLANTIPRPSREGLQNNHMIMIKFRIMFLKYSLWHECLWFSEIDSGVHCQECSIRRFLLLPVALYDSTLLERVDKAEAILG